MFLRIPHFSSINVRQISSTMNAWAKSHYDALGITPKATQADVKSAYYDLSKMYHPDRNQGSVDASNKFRDITAAYEVLGNVRLRKLYDKGVSIADETVYKHPADDDDPKTRFYRSRERRSRPPTTGRTPIYDFDEWSRVHYGETFARDMHRKKRQEFIRKMNERDQSDVRVERVIIAWVVFAGLMMLLMRDSYDWDNIGISNPQKKPAKADERK